VVRTTLSFRAVNHRSAADYDPCLQRHHLLPRQLLHVTCFRALFGTLGFEHIGFDDFRINGLLLPADVDSAIRIGPPLHRGPHRQYNAMVIDRVGQIEAGWAAVRRKTPLAARRDASKRLAQLQGDLRRQLLDPAPNRLSLNRCDPLGASRDFSQLDAMADALWGELGH
jgi:A nuclease family of the HNH/ENDO VII superfamily with conserved AHH